MEKLIDVIKIFLAALGGILSVLLGGVDAMLYLYLALIMVDYITGISKAIKNRTFVLRVAVWGLWGKILEIVMIAICTMLDRVMGTQPWLRNIAIVWFCICEGASVLENITYLGLPLPDGLVTVLTQAKSGFGISVVGILKKVMQEYVNKVVSKTEEEKKS